MIDVDKFRHDGFLLLRDAIDPNHLQPFIDVLEERVNREAPDLVSQHNLSHGYESEPFDRRLACLYDGHFLDNRIWDSALFCQEFRDLIVRSEITDPLVPLLGEDITYQGNAHLRPYLPRHLTTLPWHQDAQFYGSGSENLLWQMVQVWLPLVDADADSGCLAVVPGSHKWGLLEEAVSGADNISRSTMSRQDAIYSRTSARVEFEPIQLLPMRCGDMLIFTNLLAHTGTENRGNRVRWSIDMRFEATLGSRPITDDESEGYRVMHQRTSGRGYVPLKVRSPQGPHTMQQWIDQRNSLQSVGAQR